MRGATAPLNSSPHIIASIYLYFGQVVARKLRGLYFFIISLQSFFNWNFSNKELQIVTKDTNFVDFNISNSVKSEFRNGDISNISDKIDVILNFAQHESLYWMMSTK